MADRSPTGASAAGPVEQLTLELGRLPGIGPRSAQRLAHYIIQKSPRGAPHSMARDLSRALTRVADEVRLCTDCRNLATESLCALCTDGRRNRRLLCVVQSVSDLEAILRLNAYDGLFFVLHGALSPMEGRGPDSIGLPALLERVGSAQVTEVILALDATLEGDTTALFLASALEPKRVRTTRLASGMPHGGELEYLDRATLGRAFQERRAFAAEG